MSYSKLYCRGVSVSVTEGILPPGSLFVLDSEYIVNVLSLLLNINCWLCSQQHACHPSLWSHPSVQVGVAPFLKDPFRPYGQCPVESREATEDAASVKRSTVPGHRSAHAPPLPPSPDRWSAAHVQCERYAAPTNVCRTVVPTTHSRLL